MNAPVLDATRLSLRPVTAADLAWLHTFNALPDVRFYVDAPNTRSRRLLTRLGFTETHRSMGNRHPLRHHLRNGEGLGPAA